MREIGRSFHSVHAPHCVAAVDTLVQRAHKDPHVEKFLKTVRFHIQDEAHHVLHDPINKWGRAYDLTPGAKFLGVTATAIRADGKGLGINNNGVFQSIVHGVQMRWLIEQGFLKQYRVFDANKRSMDQMGLTDSDVSKATGDYKLASMAKAVKENHIVGDVVETYKAHAMGKRGITFAPNVEIAREIAYKFEAGGVPAMCVWDKTTDEARESAVRRLESGELLQLVNVDLFGEGFDLPAIEVASFARPTMSYGLFVQQFGRALRPTPGVDTAIIFDHVGNVRRHGLPDGNVRYTLEPTERHRQMNGARLVRRCDNCSLDYERILKRCPYCGWTPPIVERSAPEFVDGDLTELTPEALARLRGEAAKAVQPVEEYHEYLKRTCPQPGIRRNLRLHENRIEQQQRLRDAITMWAGYSKKSGAEDSEIYRRFFHTFGIDILSAQALNTGDAFELEFKILRDI
jgi:superfamily II DNA or RNA helicase